MPESASWGGVSAPGGVCSGGVCFGGVSGSQGRGCLFQGVCSRGGVSALGGVSAPGVCGIPACTEADTPTPPVNRMTNRCKNITLATASLRLVIRLCFGLPVLYADWYDVIPKKVGGPN